MRRIALRAGPVFLVASCAAVGPDYTPPNMALTPHFVRGPGTDLPGAVAERWWSGLNDPLLDDLVARGFSQNLDIQAARARIRNAEAALGRTGAAAQVDGGLAAEALREKDTDGKIDGEGTLSANAAFVFDLFGGFRRGAEGASAGLDAARFDEGTVRLAYLAEIIDAYISARYFQNAAWLTHKSVQSRQRSLEIVTRLRGAGEATDLDVAQARAVLRTAEAAHPSLKANFEANVFRIASLLAEPAGPILARMEQGAAQPLPRADDATGTPADLLRNRPDIRAAERRLAAVTATVGVAEAELYPSLTLSGVVRGGDSGTWSFGPALRLPVLGRGVLRANRNAAIEEAAEAEIAWRATVLRAVEEVQASESATRYWRRQVVTQRSAVRANDEVRALTQRSFEAGETRLGDLLDADRRALENQMALAASARDLALNWVRLQVATGRGWRVGPALSDAGL